MTRSDGLSDAERNKIIGLTRVLFPQAKIFLYGSRARGDYRPESDIDIALDVGCKLPFTDLGELRSVLEASYVAHAIDIVDLHSLTGAMKENVEKEKILWSN